MGLKSCQADVVIGAGPGEIGQGRCEVGEEVTHSPGAFPAVAGEWGAWEVSSHKPNPSFAGLTLVPQDPPFNCK